MDTFVFCERTPELFIFIYSKVRIKKSGKRPTRKYTGLMAPHVTPPLTAAVDNNIGSPAVAENY